MSSAVLCYVAVVGFVRWVPLPLPLLDGETGPFALTMRASTDHVPGRAHPLQI